MSYDTIVIGAGPAGCSVAALLAERGRKVVILERERFPRYRVGESLIPHCWYPLDRLGLVENSHRIRQAVRNIRGFLHRHGVDGELAAAS